MRNFINIFMKYFNFFIGILNVLIIFLIVLFLFKNGLSFFKEYSIVRFLIGFEWISLSNKYGLLPLLVGSLWTSLIAIAVAVPLSLIVAIYIAEYSSPKIQTFLKITIEIMAAIPSVVLGFIGLYVLSGPLKTFFNLNTGLTALTGGLMLAFMSIPTIVSITDDALRSLDPSYKEAAFALGGNKLETIFKILLPASFSGIFAGIMLGFGRIIGETMTVLMVTGNSPIMATSPLSSVRTLTATIASEMGEVVQGGTHYHALFAIGIILFLISFITNSTGEYFITKSKKNMGR